MNRTLLFTILITLASPAFSERLDLDLGGTPNLSDAAQSAILITVIKQRSAAKHELLTVDQGSSGRCGEGWLLSCSKYCDVGESIPHINSDHSEGFFSTSVRKIVEQASLCLPHEPSAAEAMEICDDLLPILPEANFGDCRVYAD